MLQALRSENGDVWYLPLVSKINFKQVNIKMQIMGVSINYVTLEEWGFIGFVLRSHILWMFPMNDNTFQLLIVIMIGIRQTIGIMDDIKLENSSKTQQSDGLIINLKFYHFQLIQFT